MAQAQGLVQRINILLNSSGDPLACVQVGATPTNITLLLIIRRAADSSSNGAFKNSMLDALVAAQIGHREVIAVHGDSDSEITSVQVIPTT